jgi:hypothetical protein
LLVVRSDQQRVFFLRIGTRSFRRGHLFRKEEDKCLCFNLGTTVTGHVLFAKAKMNIIVTIVATVKNTVAQKIIIFVTKKLNKTQGIA